MLTTEQIIKEEIQKGTPPGIILKKIGCYSDNVTELTEGLYAAIIDPATEELKKVDLKVAVATIQTVWDQFKETMSECTGTEVVVELPEGTVGLIIGLLVQTLGLKL